jgi:hypothetical protein
LNLGYPAAVSRLLTARGFIAADHGAAAAQAINCDLLEEILKNLHAAPGSGKAAGAEKREPDQKKPA